MEFTASLPNSEDAGDPLEVGVEEGPWSAKEASPITTKTTKMVAMIL